MAKATGHGSGLQVKITLWYLSGLNRQSNTVKLRRSVLRNVAVWRHAGYRKLAALELAGRVSVERRSEQSPIVTLLSAGAPE